MGQAMAVRKGSVDRRACNVHARSRMLTAGFAERYSKYVDNVFRRASSDAAENTKGVKSGGSPALTMDSDLASGS